MKIKDSKIKELALLGWIVNVKIGKDKMILQVLDEHVNEKLKIVEMKSGYTNHKFYKISNQDVVLCGNYSDFSNEQVSVVDFKYFNKKTKRYRTDKNPMYQHNLKWSIYILNEYLKWEVEK